jgi:ribosome-binding ATPase
MSLSVGIVGLPNVGKSTLFNALLKKQMAYAANFPFATIEPNIGVVPVPDARLDKLASVIRDQEIKILSSDKKLDNSVTQSLNNFPPIVPATVQFVDIAGLIAGAHKGEGLGNKFLAHIREVDAICHVVRNFEDENIIREGSSDPIADLEIIETELIMADLNTVEKNQKSKNPKVKVLAQKLSEELSKGVPIRDIKLSDEEADEVKLLTLLTAKPILIALNSSESDLKVAGKTEKEFAEKFGVNEDQVIVVSAKIEEELAGLGEDDAREYLKDLGVEKSGLERLIKKAFATLGLITFLTAGEKEVRAWTIRLGSTSLMASGTIHTDFMQKFIKADVLQWQDFVEVGGWKLSREKGLVRQEGREYLVSDGDVIEFKIGT